MTFTDLVLLFIVLMLALVACELIYNTVQSALTKWERKRK